MAAKLKKGDKVVVLAGKDKGREGEILQVMPKEGRAIVQGVNMVIRHTRQSQTSQGGRIPKEASIDLSNLAMVDPKDGGPTVARADSTARAHKRAMCGTKQGHTDHATGRRHPPVESQDDQAARPALMWPASYHISPPAPSISRCVGGSDEEKAATSTRGSPARPAPRAGPGPAWPRR